MGQFGNMVWRVRHLARILDGVYNGTRCCKTETRKRKKQKRPLEPKWPGLRDLYGLVCFFTISQHSCFLLRAFSSLIYRLLVIWHGFTFLHSTCSSFRPCSDATLLTFRDVVSEVVS